MVATARPVVTAAPGAAAGKGGEGGGGRRPAGGGVRFRAVHGPAIDGDRRNRRRGRCVTGQSGRQRHVDERDRLLVLLTDLAPASRTSRDGGTARSGTRHRARTRRIAPRMPSC